MSGRGLLSRLKRLLSKSAPAPDPPAARPQRSRKLSELCAEMLRVEEGEVLHAYQDQLGYLTIGVGRLIDKRRGGGISAGESLGLLMNDISRRVAVAETYPWFAQLDTVRQAVVVGMLFQLGEAGFAGFKNTIKDIAAGSYGAAADRMLQSRWAEQTPERAKRMAKMMRTGEWVY